MDYIGESPNALRRLHEGHKLTKQQLSPTHFRVVCVCGWFVDGLLGVPEFAEQAAYLHRTEPDLRVPGSSDISLADRLALVHQEEKANKTRARKLH